MQKTIHFRTVEWLGKAENLRDLIVASLAARPNVNDTKFQCAGEICEVRHRNVADFEVRLHLTMHVPGARKPVSPHVTNKQSGDLDEADAPAGSDFTEREIAVVVRPDSVAYVVSGRARDSNVRSALAGLIRLEHGEEIANKLHLAARADEAAIKRLLKDGVAKLDLGLALPHANADYVADGQPISLSRKLGNAVSQGLSTLFTADRSDEVIDELAHMNVGLTLNVKRKALDSEIRALTAIATEAVEDNEQFTIKTLKGDTIKRDRLILTSSYSQSGKMSYLNYMKAWTEASQFLNTV